MIINAYFTDGYYDWGKLFLDSFAYHNGQDYKMILNTKDLNKKQIDGLYKSYKNLEVKNEELDWDHLEKISGIKKSQLSKWKNITEKQKVNKTIRAWKLMIAGDDRIKTIRDLLYELPEGEHVAHFDIDTYVTGNMTDLFEFVKQNDFCTRLRIEKQIKRKGKVFRENRATLIYFQGYSINKKGKEFIDTWIKYIDKVNPANRQKGYGQTSCYYAILDMWKKYGKDGFRCNDTKKLQKWANANKGDKKGLVKRYREKFEQLKIKGKK